ncbi:hypothetical protein LEN26_005613 [Aphanomyces euteiches]|nr:hypothetical protein AeMF1_000554 [Aphanomyces euteiches]KAH9137762.1 hypothetical protein LEN26_005613 [Aphanomyces euteiches]KAH9190508.1 hypothetical protein AeNC1_007515 [Aphanomyces euteiches]
MSGKLNVGIIGLGEMGQRMVHRLEEHNMLRVTWAWDTNPAAAEASAKKFPHVNMADSAMHLMQQVDLQSVYIATPTDSHLQLTSQAVDRGLSVLCEHPLCDDGFAAYHVVERIAALEARAGVNMPLTTAPGIALAKSLFGEVHPLGKLQSVDVDIKWKQWLQQPWFRRLAARNDGSFVRQVLSEFVFPLQRVVGPLKLLGSKCTTSEGEPELGMDLTAQLKIGPVPVKMVASAEGNEEKQNVIHFEGAKGSFMLGVETRDFDVQLHNGKDFPMKTDGDALDPGWQWSDTTQDVTWQWTALIQGKPHKLASCPEALQVQKTIDAIVAADCQERSDCSTM